MPDDDRCGKWPRIFGTERGRRNGELHEENFFLRRFERFSGDDRPNVVREAQFQDSSARRRCEFDRGARILRGSEAVAQTTGGDVVVRRGEVLLVGTDEYFATRSPSQCRAISTYGLPLAKDDTM